jgi:hypothetical protein
MLIFLAWHSVDTSTKVIKEYQSLIIDQSG